MKTMNYAAQLKKLLAAEETPPLDPLAELALVHKELFETMQRNGSDISLQVEEIYDIIKDADENAKEVKNAAKRESRLTGALIAMNDLLDNLLSYIQHTGAEHASALAAKREEAIAGCDLERIGETGRQLDPRIHTVASAEYSEAPPESVINVLECGYIYRGSVIRKATVVVSKGKEQSI